MQRYLTIIVLALLTPALTGCIAGGDAEEAGSAESQVAGLTSGGFTVGSFVHDLEQDTGASLVSARVENLQVEYNQTRVTLVDWRSFTPSDGACELVSTMRYEGQGRSGGFLVHHEDEPCPIGVTNKPTVAEAVALVDRVHLPLIQQEVADGAPIFSVELAGYCGYAQDANGTPVYVWNGAGVTAHDGEVRCGGGFGSALTLAVNVPDGPAHTTTQRFIILEQVPAR